MQAALMCAHVILAACKKLPSGRLDVECHVFHVCLCNDICPQKASPDLGERLTMAEHASCSDVCLHDADCLQGYSVVADLMNVSDAKRTVEEAVQKMGGLDVLVG